MSKCVKLQRKHRQVCLGDLNTEIVLQSRTITPPTVTVDFAETFAGIATVWAKVDTVRGRTEFDGADIERTVTHDFTIRYIAGIDTETWVLLENNRYDIVRVEDFEERHEFLRLMCTKLGPDTVPVNDA